MTPFEQALHSLRDKFAERLAVAEKALALGTKRNRARSHFEASAALYRDLLAVIERHKQHVEQANAAAAAPAAPEAPERRSPALVPEVRDNLAPAVRRSIQHLRAVELESFRHGTERDDQS